uniref:hypothetical protein n=1 Tax=Halorubrum miltondacostae TaxID=3076378 RepID=UPI003529B7AB
MTLTVVAAVRPAEGSVQPIPPRDYAFGTGHLVYLVGRPGAIRRFETAAATPTEAGDADDTPGGDGRDPEVEPDDAAGPDETPSDDTADRNGASAADPDGTQRS